MDANILWYSSKWNNTTKVDKKETPSGCRIGWNGDTWKYMVCVGFEIPAIDGRSREISIRLDTTQVIKAYRSRAVRWAVSSRYDLDAYANKTDAVTENGQIASGVWAYPYNTTGGALTDTIHIQTYGLKEGTYYLYLWGGAETLGVTSVGIGIEVAATYPVTYNANGGIAAPKAQTKVEGETLILSSDIPSLTGHGFLWWESEGSHYFPGGEYTEDRAAVMTAVWAVNTYLVTYDANGGTDAPEAQVKQYGDVLRISGTIPVLPGFEFRGWNTDADGGGEDYAPGDWYYANEPLTLYAMWAVKQFTLTKDQANGTNIRVVRTNSPYAHASGTVLDSDADIFYGDVLQVTFMSLPGYSLTSKTINGKPSGNSSFAVHGDIHIATTALPARYLLTISTERGVDVAVERVGGYGPAGRLTDGAAIYHGDLLRISVQPASGYKLASLTVNGRKHQSGGIYCVEGDAAVAASAKLAGSADIFHDGRWRKYRCAVYSGGEWKTAAAKIGGRNA